MIPLVKYPGILRDWAVSWEEMKHCYEVFCNSAQIISICQTARGTDSGDIMELLRFVASGSRLAFFIPYHNYMVDIQNVDEEICDF